MRFIWFNLNALALSTGRLSREVPLGLGRHPERAL